MTWWLAALLCAIIWGIHYPLIDVALRHLSIISVLVLTTAPMIIIAPFFYNTLVQDFKVFMELELATKIQISGIALTSIFASALLFFAIDSKNAALTSLIEISYPIFVFIFMMIILNENHLNISVITGGILIFLGVGIVIFNN